MADLYFDSTEVGNDLLLGVVIEEDGEIMTEVSKRVNKKADTNYYHHALEAMAYGLSVLKEEEGTYSEVDLKTQHKQIFNWLSEKRWKEDYNDEFNKVLDELEQVIQQDVMLDITIVKGAKNKAKKYLAKEKKQLEQNGDVKIGGNLNNLFKDRAVKSDHSKVVSFFDRKRKQG